MVEARVERLQKSILAVSIVLLVQMVLYVNDSSRNISIRGKAPSPARKDLLNQTKNSENPNIDHSSLELWSPYTDFMSEEEALKLPSEVNLTQMPSPELSTLVAQRTKHNVGEMIVVRVELNDKQGHRRSYGGDCVRVRIIEPTKGAYAAGFVIDHYNGSYTVVVKALWPGNPTITVHVAHTREDIRDTYALRKKNFSLNRIIALFSNKTSHGEVECFPFTKLLNKSTEVCNMSYYNGGMPYFCPKPTTGQFECKDVVNFTRRYTGASWAVSEPIILNQTVNVTVTANETDSSTGLADKPPCSRCNSTMLWTQTSPVGYFYNNEWISTYCTTPPVNTYDNCLKGKHIILFGDSTTRQWYEDMVKRFSCSAVTEGWHTLENEPRDLICKNDEANLTVEWIVHAFPSFEQRTNIKSIAKYMLHFTYRQNVFFLIHIYVHFTSFHHSLFRDRMERILPSIKTILRENPNAKFLVKGGHTHWVKGLNDLYCYVYRTIMMEVFEEVLDSVIYIDLKDMTIARGQPKIDVHPPLDMVSQMVNYMLSFIC